MKNLFSIILVLVCVTITFSQTKKKQTTTSVKTCHYCGKKIPKSNSYVVPLGSSEGRSYKSQMADIFLVKRYYSDYPKENLRLLEAGIKNGFYFCSRKCLYSEGYSILE